jgi:signal transduction histidine kinase
MDELSKRLKIAEERLARARRMEELGYLAGGIAHDFNNLLTGILGYASLLRTFLPEGGNGYEAAGAIEQSARRAAELTRRMLEYSRRESPPLRPVGIHRLIEEAAGILSATLPGNVEIRTDLRAPADTVMGDPEILERALLHLGANAGDAMPGGGRLTLATGSFASDGTTSFADVPVPEGDYISLRVSDTGCGIPESLRNRVFAPFFTTKPEGRGTGLGLALVSRCVRQHGGFLRLESREGEGTTFEILLPVRPSTT